MSTHLVRELQNFYERKGNKVLFSNGQTLNQLAFQMWERLNYQGVDTSVLSRVLSGERIFTPGQLEGFCKILKLSEQNQAQLREALMNDLAARHNIPIEEYIESYSVSKTLDFSEDTLDKIHSVIWEDPELAISWAKVTLEQIDKLLPEVKRKKTRHLLLKAKSDLLFKQGIACNRLLPQDKIWGIVSPLVQEEKRLAKELGSSSLHARATFNIGVCYYVLSRNQLSLKHCMEALEHFKDESEKLLLLRHCVLNSAWLGDKKLFKQMELLGEGAMEKGNLTDVSTAVMFKEGLALARAALNIPGEFEALREAERLLRLAEERGERPALQKMLLLRSKFNIATQAATGESGYIQKLKDHLRGRRGDFRVKVSAEDKVYLEKIGKRAWELAVDRGFIRHAEQLSNSLNVLLN